MPEIVNDSRPELADARGFVRQAARDLRLSRRVAWQLFLGDLRIRHRRSVLGYAWLVLPALAATGVGLYLQHRRIIDTADTTLSYGLHVLAGMVIWQVFVEALTSPMQQLSANRQLLATTRVPYESLVLAGLIMVGLGAVIRCVVLVVALVAAGQDLALSALLVPFGLAAVALLGLAPGLLIAPAGLISDDVNRGLPLVLTFWFFLTPVIYPAPESGLLRLNPVTPLLETTRTWLTTPAAPAAFFFVTGLALLLTIAAWLLSRLGRLHVAARLG